MKKPSFPTLLFGLVSLLGLWWHLLAVWKQNLFGDEVHSLFFFASHDWHSLLLQPVEPIHPNGLYLLLKFFWLLTPDVLALRLWLFVLFLASCGVLAMLLKKLSLPQPVIWGTVALWASSAYLWHFTFQLRMYGPAMLLMLLSLNAFLGKKFRLSIVFDWLAVGFAYGAIVFVLSKWLAWLILSLSGPQKKQITATRWFTACLGLFPSFFIFVIFLTNSTRINADFLYWVHPAALPDLSLGLASFFTGLFLPYFEGYSTLSHSWNTLGIIGNSAIIVLLSLGLCFLWRERKIVSKQWDNVPANQQLVLMSALFTFALYAGIFGWSWLFGGHLFHIRQLFPVAVVGWIGMSFLLWKIWDKSRLFAVLLIVVFAGINQFGIALDSIGSRQAYVHHFESLPGTPLIASRSDVELIYKQCGVFDRSLMEEACAKKQIFFSDAIPEDVFPNNRWWFTTRGKSEYDTQRINKNGESCTTISTDYFECTKEQL